MALTLAQLRSHATFAVGGSIPTDIGVDAVVNFAGRHLYTMHKWRWAERPLSSLGFTADQSYVALPSDLLQITGAWAGADLSSSFRLVTPHEIAERRKGSTVTTGEYVGAMVWPTQTNQTTAMGAPRLEIHPTPAANVTAAISLMYRAKWIELTDAAHIANVPEWIDPLLSELVSACARGFIEDRRSELLDQVAMGSTFRNAVTTDIQQQPEYGEVRNGPVADLGQWVGEWE